MNPYKASRENAGLTQKEAAISLGVSVQAVSYWETGSRLPSIEKLIQMADLYNVSTDYLLGRMVKQEKLPPKGDNETDFQFHLDNGPQDENELEAMILRILQQELDKRGV